MDEELVQFVAQFLIILRALGAIFVSAMKIAKHFPLKICGLVAAAWRISATKTDDQPILPIYNKDTKYLELQERVDKLENSSKKKRNKKYSRLQID